MLAYSEIKDLSIRRDLDDPAALMTLDQNADTGFDPGRYFGEWLQSLEGFRDHYQELSPGVYLRNDDHDFVDSLSPEDDFPEQLCADGMLVVTEQGALQGDVEVNVAVIDGLFKGKISATEQVVLENHALVIGEINTPKLTIRGGAIIEGRCYFAPTHRGETPLERWERPGWQALKVGFARVWRSRLFQ